MSNELNMVRNYKFLNFITSFFVAVLLISNITSTKVVEFGFFTFDGGTLLFPISYIFGDVLTEVYGFKEARKVIWIGFICAAMMSLIVWIIGILPSASEWTNQAAYDTILGTTPRIVLASLIAYFSGSFSNSVILSKMKILTKGKWLWTRTIGSTIVGEGIDSLIFVGIAFFGVYSMPLLISIFISNYIFKVGFEVVLTPVTYKVVAFLKNVEKVDTYDYETNYNPFILQNR
jgi:queuosine precursor transporter